jgi:metal-responsive CopG/Arc/MetJ family transcriptional regulator
MTITIPSVGRRRLSKSSVSVTVRLPASLLDRIDRKAANDFCSRRAMIEALIEKGLDHDR